VQDKAVPRDLLGRPYSPALLRELRLGKPPANKGKHYPAEVLSPAEVRRLLAAARGMRQQCTALRNATMIAVQWRCGLRVAELLALEPRDIDLEYGELLVRNGKGSKRRALGLDAETVALLRSWMEWRDERGFAPDTTLFVTIVQGRYQRAGRPISYTTYVEMLKRCARRARIYKRVHTHGLRHTFAVELLREGVPPTIIQKLLGHKSLHHTLVYLDHLLPGEAIDRQRQRRWPAEIAAELVDEDLPVAA
jgi:integrase